ncbi:protein of unknown function DUF1929 [Reticulomyxa filosa]|uniref:Uncharacterized protein n=1 Tax=Reticulomyxa filosa TaxID=46433 RepID=X6NLD4_RETFI|nr:protein of unknown function DUF1929 [Reticulomyxa filosa]|eukprot:ETO26723.1 protein of unknown function DUF1929 [Reticulomyxa filosa]
METETNKKTRSQEEKGEWKKLLLVAFVALAVGIGVGIGVGLGINRPLCDGVCIFEEGIVGDVQYPVWDNTIGELRALKKKKSLFQFEITKNGINATLYGQWQTVVPSNESATVQNMLGMQTVHSLLLPSGKVLFASGSSWRNSKDKTQEYPYVVNPPKGLGLFDKATDPFEWSKSKSYYSMVHSVGIYDPESNTFFRIPHPLPIQPDPDNSSWFLPTDLFCCGQLQLRDGNAMLIGGTQYYRPRWTGAKTTHIFNWTKELSIDWTLFDWTQMPNESSPFYPWEYSGNTRHGRWYPHALSLTDGRLVVFSGYTGYDSTQTEMFDFEFNTDIDIFDYEEFLAKRGVDVNSGWKTVDVKSLANSPFATVLPNPPQQSMLNCTATPTNQRQCDSYKNDSFKLYPHNYLLPDGRIYLTGEGDYNSLRTTNSTCIRRVNFTYFMTVSSNRTHPAIAFARGPERPDQGTISGTTVVDPNTGNINLYGGMTMPTSGTALPGLISADNIELGTDARFSNHFAGSRGTRKLEVYTMPKNINDIGSWTMEDEYYLGPTLDDDRTMLYALILPTKQILIICGGNFDLRGSVMSPLLLTPMYYDNGQFSGEYKKTRMAPSSQPRFYHSIAMLLPDARVLVSGGNCARATIDVNAPEKLENISYVGQPKPNLQRIQHDVYFFRNGLMANEPNDAPTENWDMEIFTPPYLFIDGDRRTTIDDFVLASNGQTTYTVSKTIAGKVYYLMHSGLTYHVSLDNLPTSGCSVDAGSLVIIKLASATHGWNLGQMLYSLPFQVVSSNTVSFVAPDQKANNIVPAFYTMFYVDCRGKPSLSIMVRFDDDATSPF